MSAQKKLMPVRIIVTVIYVIGIAISGYLTVKCFLPPASEPNPDAMIPFTENESAYIKMAFGFPFMLASCLSVIWVYGLKKTEHSRRNILFALIPALMDGIPFLVVAGVILIMLAEGFLEVLGILP